MDPGISKPKRKDDAIFLTPPEGELALVAAAARPSSSRHERAHDRDTDTSLPELVQGMAQGRESALGKLYDATSSRVYSLALRILGDPASAEEVVADVYLQAWRQSARYDPQRGKIITWLLMICRSRALDSLRRRQEEEFSHPEPHSLQEVSGAADPSFDILAAMQEGSRIHEAMRRLPPIQRQMVALAFFRGYSHAEISSHTRIPLGTVKTHVRRALQSIRGIIDGDPSP